MAKMKKTWLTVQFSEGGSYIEASLNYETRVFYLSHGSNDKNVTFNSEGKNAINEMKWALDRAKCVSAALALIKKELCL